MTHAAMQKMKKAELIQHLEATTRERKHLLRCTRWLIRKLTQAQGAEQTTGRYTFPDKSFVTLAD